MDDKDAGTIEASGGPESIRERVVEQLRTVFDPEIPVNIYELGLIYEVKVEEDGRTLIRMTLTTPMCPAAEVLPPEVESKARASSGRCGPIWWPEEVSRPDSMVGTGRPARQSGPSQRELLALAMKLHGVDDLGCLAQIDAAFLMALRRPVLVGLGRDREDTVPPIGPVEVDQLRDPHPRAHQQEEHRVHGLVPRHLEEPPHLLGRQGVRIRERRLHELDAGEILDEPLGVACLRAAARYLR